MLQNLINYTTLADRKIINVFLQVSKFMLEAEKLFSHILFNVVNHSTYHRGQVAAQFRMNGISPPSTDYIMLKREGLL